MKLRIIFIFITFVFTLCLSSGFAQAAEPRALELIYPTIPGVTTPSTVSSGLPEYVKYIFSFSVILIGLIILGALIYSGIQYFTSLGNPAKLTAAKQGIISAFLGAIILLSSIFIFNTINPQLTIFELPEPDVIEPIVSPGIYLCNYDVSGISNIIKNYTEGDRDERIEAAQDLKIAMDEKLNDEGTCFKVNSSGNLKNFVFKPATHTAFAIPEKEYVYDEGPPPELKIVWKYNFGIIFHEKDNFRGEGKLIEPYQEIEPHPGLDFNKVRSVTFFTKPDAEPSADKKGIILYQCLNFNEGGLCPEGVETPKKASFPLVTPGDDITKVNRSTLKDLDLVTGDKNDEDFEIEHGTRSIQIDSPGSYFAIMFSEEDYTEDCEVISNNDNNLFDNRIGRCGNCSYWFREETSERLLKTCYPCLESMIVVKGKVIK